MFASGAGSIAQWCPHLACAGSREDQIAIKKFFFMLHDLYFFFRIGTQIYIPASLYNTENLFRL